MQVSQQINQGLQINRTSPSPSSSPYYMTSQSYNPNYWPSMGQEFLSALPRNIQSHKRGSSGSSVASAGPASPHQTNTYHPRIVNHEADYSPSRYDFEYQQPTKTFNMAEPMIFSGNQYGAAVDMRRIPQSEDRSSYGPQSVSSISHHNSPATPQTWDDSYDNGFSAAYQQSLQDVFPEPSYKVNNNHRHTLQEQFSKSQQQHLRTNSPTSMPRERSPFKPTTVSRPVPQLQKQRTSVSPKELMLGPDHVEEKPSLFPEYNRQPSNFSQLYQSFDSSQTMPQQYPFVSHQVSDSTPDFPAHLVSMESTKEESLPSSQQSLANSQRLESRTSPSRPADVTSAAGTYSCTYHGCPQRFDSPAKLQKHKREGHRQTETIGATTTSSLTQAGPHRCDRINPSTGKPCNSVFSRPYDLTRHEDTIHNNRKLKVRCHLCTEEKTFSRNDALTRHMRVVHPDVDWVGKQKKRSVK